MLLLGKPKAGKTTLVKKVIAGLSKTTFSGFFTEEIKEKGERIGFKAISTDGKEGILAHINPVRNIPNTPGISNRDNHKSPFRVSKYFVNVTEFEEVALKAINNAKKEKDLIIIDEIGKMELFSQKFKQAVEEIFINGHKKILATVPISDIPIIRKLKSLPDVETIEVTENNRDRLVNELISKLD